MNVQRFAVFLIILVALLGLTSAELTQAKDGSIGLRESQASVGAATSTALSTGFTYQGQLTESDTPAEGDFDFLFELYDAETSGTLIGSVALEDITVTDGIFTVTLDFGSGVFEGQARWLEISVRPGDESGSYTLLSPRQALMAAPHAQYALEAGTVAWGNLSENPIPGNCATGEILAWNESLETWECTQDSDTTYAAGFGLGLNGTTFDVVTNTIQARVTGSCSVGKTIRAIRADGSVECQHDAPLNRAQAPDSNILSTLDFAGNIGSYTSITIGSDGLPIISYRDSTNDDLKVAHCMNTACTGAHIATLDWTGDVGAYTSIAIGSDGLPVISYYDNTNGDLKVAHCDNPGCNTATTTAVDTTGDVGYYSSIAIGTRGMPVISYYDHTNDDLKVAVCIDLGCSSATISTVDSTGNVGLYTSITIGVDGMPVISYYDNTGDNLKVAHCDNLTCTSASTNTADTTGNVGLYTSITIGVDGLPVISYFDNTNDDLKIAHCNDLDCTSGAINAIDTAGNVGSYTSITIGADGLPVIGYYDATNANLKVAHCTDPVCTSASSTVIDSSTNLNAYIAITIGADGLPVISYYDATDDDLKATHCANAFCLPFWRRR